MVSFLKKISKEEGDLSTPVSRYNTNWLPRGKANLRLLVKYVEKMFQSVTQSTDVCRIWRFIWTAGSINCGLQFRRMNRTTQLPLQHLSARPNKCFHACSFDAQKPSVVSVVIPLYPWLINEIRLEIPNNTLKAKYAKHAKQRGKEVQQWAAKIFLRRRSDKKVTLKPHLSHHYAMGSIAKTTL